jgi:phosphatidylglycerol---prolipoprotein diacylglyceryl transferase
MFPTFGRIFGEPIPAYFALLTLGFVFATWRMVRWARMTGIDHEAMIDLGLIAALGGLCGARLLHVFADGYFWDYVHLCTDPNLVVWRSVTDPAECAGIAGRWDRADGLCHASGRACFAWAAFWNGGLAYYGGLIAASGACLWFLRRERLPVAKVCDAAALVLPIGLVFGRLGCFLGGCCFGITTDSRLGLTFPAFSPASEKHFRDGLSASKGLPSLPVHPTQLYEAAGCLLIAWVLRSLVAPRKRRDGQVMLAFLGLYAVLRFGLEYLRDDDRGAVWGLSTSQWISALALLGVAFCLRWLGRRQPASAPL